MGLTSYKVAPLGGQNIDRWPFSWAEVAPRGTGGRTRGTRCTGGGTSRRGPMPQPGLVPLLPGRGAQPSNRGAKLSPRPQCSVCSKVLCVHP